MNVVSMVLSLSVQILPILSLLFTYYLVKLFLLSDVLLSYFVLVLPVMVNKDEYSKQRKRPTYPNGGVTVTSRVRD